MLVQFLGTTGIIAIRVVTSVVAIQRTRGTIAVVRIDAETQSQRREYRSCRHLTAQPPFPGFGGRVPMPDLTGELTDFGCRPWRHDTLRRVVVGYFCLSFSHIFIFCLSFLLPHGTGRLVDGF